MLNFTRIQVLGAILTALISQSFIEATAAETDAQANPPEAESKAIEPGKTENNQTAKASSIPRAGADWLETYNAGLKALEEGRLSQGEKLLKDTLKMEEKDGADEEKRVQSAFVLADFYRAQRRYPEAEALLKMLLARQENSAKQDLLPSILSRLAGLLKSQKKYDESLALYKRVLTLVEKKSGADSADAATVHANLGLLYQRMDKPKEAENEEHLAIKLFQNKLGEKSKEAAQCMADLASMYMQMHNSKKAIPLLESALAVFESSSPQELAFATCAEQLGTAYFAEGKYAEAEALARKALAVYQKKLGANNPEVAVTLSNLGYRLAKQGKNQDAIDCFRKSMAMQEKAGGPYSAELLANLRGLTEVYVSQADYEKTEPLLRRDLAIRQKRWGEKNIALVAALRNLSNCLVLEGKVGNEPEALMSRADAILMNVPDDQKKNAEMLISQDIVRGLDISPKKDKKSAKDPW